MQRGLKGDLVYLLIILESAGKIDVYSGPFDNSLDFYQANEQLNFNGSLLLLSNIGEQIRKISTELKSKYAKVEWKKILSVRNRITHDYTGIDFRIAFDIVKKEIPELKISIQDIIRRELTEGNFDKEDFKVGRSSTFYRHIDFDAIG